MKLRSLIVLSVLAAALAVPAVRAYRWIAMIPEVREFVTAEKTTWRPEGPRTAGRHDYSVIPEPDAFHTMHVGIDNTDELWIAVAPEVALDWVAEPEMYIPEGPTFDSSGNLYFSPYNPKEDVSLVALDRITGERRWSVAGAGPGSGAILVLNDPDAEPRADGRREQLIYHGTYTTSMALRGDGTEVWSSPNGLTRPTLEAGERDYTHVWGMNYHPGADAIIGVTMDGHVYAHDRRTGRPLLEKPFKIPGAPATVTRRPPAWIAMPANNETDAVFGPTPDGTGLFTAITDVIFGNGFQVANFYAIHPDSGRIYIAATAPDEQDGEADGVSRNGALYLLSLERGNGEDNDHGGTDAREADRINWADQTWSLRVVKDYVFNGGTGSTPTVRADGRRVVVSDDRGHVIMLDADLNELWRVNVGAQVAASVAVSSDNAELYAVTKFSVFKLRDAGDHGEIVWKAKLDAYPGFDNFNALTPTIAANGVAVSVGAGRRIRDQHVMHKVGVGLLDRVTGELRSFAEGREESIAVTVIGPDGGYYIASSPVRRAATRGLLGEAAQPLSGGIQRYKPVRLDLLVRDAVCAAHARAENSRSLAGEHPDARRVDVLQIRALLRQAREALPLAVAAGDFKNTRAVIIDTRLGVAASGVSLSGLDRTTNWLRGLCEMLE